MASSSSVKDLCKVIIAYIVEPALPLPDDVRAAIDAYLDKHEIYDDAVADRLQEELVAIFEKYVRGNTSATGPWMAVLRRIQMALQSPEKVLFWFDACQNILDNTPLDKAVVKETIAAMMNTALLAEKLQDSFEKESTSNPIIDRLLSIWIDNFYPAHIEGNKSLEHNEQLLREALGQFGRRKPKEFFASLNKLFIKRTHRKPLLRFFCAFIQGQPPHLYQILETRLWTSLLLCLQLDTSTTVVSAALTALIMLLPHMPSDLVPHLPTLFNIYARLLFWEQERSGSIEMPSLDAAHTASWESCVYEPESEDLEIGHLGQYFSVLYGLYPINLMDYIRKPQRHLRHAETLDSSSIVVQPTEIRHHSEQFCSIHVLHPNFYTLTIESEKTDFSRWMKCEAAEVVAGCMGLRTTTEADPFTERALPPAQTVDVIASAHIGDVPQRVTSDPALLSSNKVDNWRKAQFCSAESVCSDRTPSMMLRRGSQSSQPSNRESGDTRTRHTDSPTQLTQSPSHTQLQDMIKSNKTIKSGLHQTLANDSVASLALSHPDSNADRSMKDSMPPPALPPTSGAIPPSSDLNALVVQLQRRVLLLENDLSFERFLKQQHMTHIGDLRRRQVVEAATEAETQNLLMTNRNLKNRYDEAKKAEMQVRKESEKSRAMAKKWETDFYNKLKNMREDLKKSTTEVEELENELAASKEECDKLRVLLCDAEVKELNWKQHAQSVEIHSVEMERLRDEVSRLTVSERDFQAKDLERQEAMNRAAETQNRLEELQMKLTAQEAEVQRTKRLFQGQLAALQEQLSRTQEERSRPGANSDLAIESSLAGSRAKQAELQKQFDLLQRKYTKLQSSLLDMNSSAPAPMHTSTGGERDGSDYLSTSASPVMMRAAAHGPPESAADAKSHNGMPPLDSKAGAGMTAMPSPSGKGQEGTGRSPEQRHFAGLHSRLRRDGGDKGKDDGGSSSSKPKKEKRSTLRGIRGFV